MGYIPSYDTSYYQPMYHLPVPSYSGQPPHQPMATRPFNTDAPSFTPKVQSSKRITIIDPLTGTEVTPVAVATPPLGETKRYAIANVAGTKNAEDDNKPVFTMPTRTIIKIVNPVEKEREERERKEKEEQSRKEEEKEKVKVKERLEREEKERIECEAREAEERKKILKAKEAEEHRIAEEKAERERQEALAKKAEQERKEKDERDRLEAEKRFMEEKAEAIAKAAAEDKVRMEAEAAEKIRIEKEKAEVEAEERVRKLEKERAEAEAEEGVRKLERERAEAEAVERDRILEKEKAEVKIEEQARKPVAERRIELETEKVRKDQVAGTDAALSHVTDSSKPGMSVDVARTETLTDFGASVRIENFDSVVYPSHIQSPATDGQGKVRYDRDFLMQFMNVCTDKPESLPDIPGNEENGHRNQIPGSSQRGSQHGSQHGVMSSSRGKPFTMGSFKMNDRPTGVPLSARNMSGDARLNRSSSDTQFTLRANSYLSRPPSQRGSRGGRRGGGGGGSGRGGHHSHQDAQLTIPLADIVPLEKTKNAWTPNVNTNQAITVISQDETLDQEQVARKVKGLLNKLTLEKFDSISDKVIDIANLSANEEDGTTLKHCIQIIFEKATDEPNFGSVYARLCQKLMEKVSNDVKDNTVPGSTGGKLFRKYLLHRCQEEFVRGWKDKAASNGAPLGDKDGPDLMSDEYYIMMKAKRQGLGLIHFIGELFKLSMLTEKIMHECVKKLLANVKDPEEEEIEGLCKLMTTVGLQLDRPEAKPHIDVYFARMTELAKNTKLASRIRFMVQDVIDLRANNWVSRRAASGPKTIAAIHEEAARQQEEKELMRRTASSGGGRGLPNRREQLNRGQSFRGSGDARQDHGGISSVGADGWSTVGTSSSMTKKAGDLSSFGNTSRSKVSGLPSLGPSGSVFGALNKSKRSEAKAASQNDSGRTVTSVNSFSALEGEVVDRRVDVETEKPMERRRLLLLPRSTSVLDTESVDSRSEPDETLSGTGAAAGASANNKKTEEEAKRSIANTVKEFMSIKDMDELMISVQELDTCYRPLLVTEFVNQSMEMTQSDIDCVAEIFKRLRTEKIVSPEDFEAGFSDPLEFLPDTAIDVPNAYKFTGQLLEAAGMDPTRATT
ncbi:hypothetical protein BG004_007270 [Podila humilis]|nr:hypothetical protein BG004_007270 [Podila humilis]